MPTPEIPTLSAVTRPAVHLLAQDLTAYASASAPIAWLRGGDGMVGIGEAARWEGSGPGRFDEARRWWDAVVARASLSDEVGARGTGLLALGTFSFSSTSSMRSVLIVPRVIVGRRGTATWTTHVSASAHAEHEDEPRPTAISPAPPVGFGPGSVAEDAYLASVEAALARIGSGELDKVVLARDLSAALPEEMDPRSPLRRLADGYPDCWTFAVDGMIGSTPEMLARVESRTVRARVLAGSTARGSDAATDSAAALALATSDKDRDEHGYALRSLLSALAPHTSSLVASEQPFTLKLPNLWHLASDVEGCLSDRSTSLDLAAALHPTAAVAGTPTPRSLAVIDELEGFDRGRYAAPVGWIDADGDGDWAIALRCAQLGDETVTAYAGAGVVAGSDPRRELAETGMKFLPIVDAFG